ncbi:DUF3833 family protein [Sulfitobacter albidus]|uniref:DUF3833 family protein n=1 Tax=Sulfitobacter albidus TaxID=2829501 RepID=A0A975PMR9_9RHOB|nr:DUF3833 family protein [Sulfitobacter albidus]QUJ76535.1 DUF3833 family protein [Sulfitobacter albidus]
MNDALFFFLLGVALMAALVLLRRRLADFPAQRAEDYVGEAPTFDMRRHLNGPMHCVGAIFGPLGRVTSTFTAEFNANWKGDVCTIEERFTYHDGTVQEREWTLEMTGEDSFDALAEDVPGTGKGHVAGPTVLFRYPITLPQDSGGHTLSALDCMYLAPDGTVVNRSQFRKFGFRVAELVATISKKEAA